MKNLGRSCGVFWINTSKSGNKYLSGSIGSQQNRIKVMLFKNSRKQKDTDPDYFLYSPDVNLDDIIAAGMNNMEHTKTVEENPQSSGKETEDDLPF